MFVSVIIPTYNRAAMLSEAVESVLAQDYPHKELIVVDDGSADHTSEVVKGWVGSGFHYGATGNLGVSHARNTGIRCAKGELIAFLDSDDIWLPGKLSRQVEFLEQNLDIHICQTEEIWIRNGRRVNPKNIHKKYSGWIFDRCIPRCIVSPSAVMLRRGVFEDVGLFDEAMPACEDYDLWLRAALRYQIVTLPEQLIIKRGGHPGQLSAQWGLDRWRIYALEKVLKSQVIDPGLEEIVRGDIARRKRIYSAGAKKRMRGGEDTSRLRHYYRARYSA